MDQNLSLHFVLQKVAVDSIHNHRCLPFPKSVIQVDCTIHSKANTILKKKFPQVLYHSQKQLNQNTTIECMIVLTSVFVVIISWHCTCDDTELATITVLALLYKEDASI